MPFTVPHTIVAGELVTTTTMNNEWGGNVSFLANPPACRVFNSAVIGLTSGTPAALTFDSERYDTDGTMHSTASLTGRITFNTAGLYLVIADVSFTSNATGVRAVDLRVNGATFISSVLVPAASGDSTRIVNSTVWKFAAADYVEVMAYQNSGTTPLNILVTANYSPEFSATWIGLG